ncbi:DUF4097 domain-containing protein [Shewanella sp. AS1]|uniref:DUF4097 domain-containing protein n=1 Tax=Shewanella sp. AS1 TaxID=2907626 RepID=UPI001F3A79C0|nr:DUF4097 domain-containing protein [Shewanella sp. AS1]MCE9679684.1 DUF4097 domain-containing protein [Shewanella sp. AS1]
MNFRPLLLVPAFGILLSGCIINVNGANARSFSEHEQQELVIDANDLSSLVARTGAGSLTIIGEAGLTQVQVAADIYTYEGVEPTLTLLGTGNKAELIADFDSSFTVSFSNSPYIDLVVRVPAQMMLDIEDGSGFIEIKGVDADMKINDGSGSLTIEGGRALDITDGSGAIRLTNVGGAIDLEDGSGDIEIANVAGSVKINDGSGGIMLEQVKGDVWIDDGSGFMTVKAVQGMVTIDDGSGDIRVEQSKGLKILESGSGSVSFDKIDGPVSMD